MRFKFLIVLLVLNSICVSQNFTPNSQSNPNLDFKKVLSGIKYIYIEQSDDFIQTLKNNPEVPEVYALLALKDYLKYLGFSESDIEIKGSSSESNFLDQVESFCDVLTVVPSWEVSKNGGWINITLSFWTCTGENFIFKSSTEIKPQHYLNKIREKFLDVYIHLYNTKKEELNLKNRLSLPSKITKWNEEELKIYYRSEKISPIEGIYEELSLNSKSGKYTLAIVKSEDKYDIIYLNGVTNKLDWSSGELKGSLIKTASPSIFKSNWLMSNKSENTDVYVSFENASMEIIINNKKHSYIKLFPTDNNKSFVSPKSTFSGTGFALTKDGLVVTNSHVINGYQKINIKGVNGVFNTTYSAKVVAEDVKNDLAIIKIDDSAFTKIGEIPYLINTKTVDVGNSVFVLGYPLRSSMGDEIKLTTGIISSRSGFQGDITSYQISAPIQPGNSGGPLFDDKGAIIGIVNSKHTNAENASYAVKAIYLLNLFEQLEKYPQLSNNNLLQSKNLTEQVKIIKDFTYIIEVNY